MNLWQARELEAMDALLGHRLKECAGWRHGFKSTVKEERVITFSDMSRQVNTAIILRDEMNR